MSHWLIFITVLAAGCKDRDRSPPPPPRGSDAAISPGSPTRTGPGPALPAVADAAPEVPAPAPAGPAVTFRDEPVDKPWAGQTERAIADRLAALAPRVECRTSVCQVVVVAQDPDRASASLAAVEGPSGLLGLATSVYLADHVIRPDGARELVVYASFDR